jgi:hypothetical protein
VPTLCSTDQRLPAGRSAALDVVVPALPADWG